MGTQPECATYIPHPKTVKNARWVPSMLQNSAVITYHTRTGSTVCSLPPFPHTCLQLSACHCRSSQIQLPPTPPGTCTPAHYCKMLHSVMGSCKPRRKRGHFTCKHCYEQYRLLGAKHFHAWPPAISTTSLKTSHQKHLTQDVKTNCFSKITGVTKSCLSPKARFPYGSLVMLPFYNPLTL